MKLLKGEKYIMPDQDKAFNGDEFACRKFLELKEKFNITKAVELGSAVGGTAKWLGENFSEVVTIEINPEFRDVCIQRVEGLYNITCLLGSTVDLLGEVLKNCDDNTILHIDSHWGSYNPLLRELDIIKESGVKPVIEIHDFKVPNHPELGYDTYGGQDYEWNWIEKNIDAIYGKKGYVVEYNSEATGAKRGMIFIYKKDV